LPGHRGTDPDCQRQVPYRSQHGRQLREHAEDRGLSGGTGTSLTEDDLMMATGNIPWRRATQGTMAPACMQTNPNWTCSDEVPTHTQYSKLLSVNIDMGITIEHYLHYLAGGRQHLLPDPRR